MFYYFLLLIVQPVALQIDYYYVIKFDQLTSPDKRHINFRFGDRVFKTYDYMRNGFKRKFSFIPVSRLFLSCDSEIMNNRLFKTNSHHRYSSIDSPSYNPVFTVPNTINLIKVTFKFGHIIYVCNKSKYGELHLAKDCVKDLYKYGNNPPKNLILKGDQEAQNIWKSLWKGCFYQCYTRDSFFNLKNNLLQELNELRLKVKLQKLNCYSKLSQYADKNYNTLYYVDSESAWKLKNIPFKEITAYTEPQLAFTVVNEWYNQLVTAKKRMRFNEINRRHLELLTTLFDKTTTEACFGAVNINNRIIVNCVFN